jgi:hypothetical protein
MLLIIFLIHVFPLVSHVGGVVIRGSICLGWAFVVKLWTVVLGLGGASRSLFR